MFVPRLVNFLAHKIVHSANFCKWDGPFTISSLVLVLDDRNGIRDF
jgi:hypothetical protein